jgi:hypothetical protein
MIRRVPVHNAVKNQQEILEGEIVDELREPSVFVDRNGKTYDASRGISFGDLPNGQLVQLPRTTWYGFTPQPHSRRTGHRRVHERSRRMRPDL